MDFQSAMETFAEAWVAANSGKLGIGSAGLAGPGAGSVDLNLNVNDSVIQQQLGKGVGAPVYSSSSASASAASATAENGGLDYPKIPSGTITPGSASGMDLSSTKRIKGVSRKISHAHPHSHSHLSAANPNNPSHLQDFDPNSLLAGHHPSLGKSMPIHCIIEVSSRDRDLGKCETSGGNSNVTSSEIGSCRLSPSDMSSLNVKDSSTAPENKVVEVDDFVIIPAGTPFQDVVTTVLTLLGYPKDTIRQAQGTIALRNWKPLRLDQVCDSPHKTVGDILNDLTNHATLRVLVTRAKGGTTEDLKEKLLRLLLAQSSTLLMGAGCPLDEVTLSQLVKGHWPQNLAEDVKRRFDQWYTAQHQQSLGGLVESLQQQQPHHQHSHPHQHSSHSMISSGQHQIGGNGGSGLSNTHHHSHLVNGSSGGALSAHQHHHHHHDLQSNKSYDDDHTNHPVFHGLTTQKTRMRTSFDPEMELPKLQQWFAENPHPSRHQIQQYVRDLNLLDCRKDRKPLDVNNVIYWFKNARAAQKRNEMRYNGLSPHQSFSHHHTLPHSQNPSHHHHHHLNTSPMGMHANGSELRGERDGSHDMHSHQHQRRRVSSGEQDRENNNDPEHDSVHDNSGSSCRDSDDQDTKEHMDDNENDQENNDKELNCERDGESNRAKDNRHHHQQGQQEKKVEVDSLVVVKEEHDDDFISVDVELNEANGNNQSMKNSSECCNNNEPKDLSSASQCEEGEDNSHKDDKSSIIIGGDEKKHSSVVNDVRHSPNETGELITGEASNNSSSTSASPRSSPGISPNHHYDFAGPPSMVSRYHPFFDHPSFMAYRHFNSFNFGQNFSGPNGADGHGAYEASLGVVGRKALLPMGKPSPGIDIFHDFPSGVAMVPSRGSSHPGGPANAETISRLRGDEMFPRPASSADIISSIINSNRELGLSPLNLGSHHPGQSSLALDERRKRNRTFIDPVTEVPRLEQWFGLNTHPSHNLILKYTDELNRMPYRQKFPKLEPKNVQFWFKNRRAKCKRLKMTL